ncbi:MAG: hypothetical protein ACK4R2_04820 [Roseateles sp.]
MLVTFQVRTLLERHKVNDRARSAKMPVVRYKEVENRPFTNVGSRFPEDRFDMENPDSTELSVHDVCNRPIHYYWMQTWSERTAFDGMLVFSDYMRNKRACEILIEDFLALFNTFAQDSSAVTEQLFHWNEKKQDDVARYAH